jgi:hypothetical protein
MYVCMYVCTCVCVCVCVCVLSIHVRARVYIYACMQGDPKLWYSTEVFFLGDHLEQKILFF